VKETRFYCCRPRIVFISPSHYFGFSNSACDKAARAKGGRAGDSAPEFSLRTYFFGKMNRRPSHFTASANFCMSRKARKYRSD
jgi:hypothetical protein